MKKIALAMVALLITAGAAFAKDYEVSKKAGPFNVTVTLDKSTPATGDNEVTVTVKDAKGQVVKGAKVIVDYSMPAMPGMPPMNYQADALAKGDGYKATMNLSMAGPWNVIVKVRSGAQHGRMQFSIDAK